MITAVDTSVLLDIFTADARFGPRSRDALRQCLNEGLLIACEVVWAEVAAAFPDGESASRALAALGIRFVPPTEPEALAAGTAWREYRRRGGARERVMADFLIAAHATHHADRLLTRDRGFYRRYFAKLSIVDPSAPGDALERVQPQSLPVDASNAGKLSERDPEAQPESPDAKP